MSLDENRVDEAIQRALPIADEEIRIGNEPTFRFCVELQRFLPKDTDIPLRPILERYFEQADGRLVDEHGDPLTLEGAWDQFLEVWPKVLYPGILHQAIERAQEAIAKRPELSHLDPTRRRLARVCYEMQQIVGDDKDFYLSSYDAAEILWQDKKHYRKALRMFNRLSKEGLLECTKKGDPKKYRANHYRYTGH